MTPFLRISTRIITLQGTNISPKNVILKMIVLFPRWDMLDPWRVSLLEVMLRYVKIISRDLGIPGRP